MFSSIRTLWTSILFPYTTLFRSPNEYILLSAHFDSWDGASGATDNGTGSVMMMEVLRILKQVYPRPDRKSTRLNSSHLVISYADFCLKQKKDQHNNMPRYDHART